MISIPGYVVVEKLSEGTHTTTFRGYHEIDQEQVTIKLLTKEKPSLKEIEQLEHEYEILHELHGEGAVNVYKLEKYQDSLAIILEDCGTLSLKKLLSQKKLTLNEFLSLAIHITTAIEKIHQHHIIHKNINPENILLNEATQKIKIIGFDLAVTFPREMPEVRNLQFMNENMLSYIAPEQTGRMNRGIDYRTDYYSLGMTLYEMATGTLPFVTHDMNELIHSHIAKLPQPPDKINPKIPHVVSTIIMKLLGKMAEDRYQSILGLKMDLQRCIKELHENGKISDFPLGSQDYSAGFQISKKLYGRDSDVKKLHDALDRISKKNISYDNNVELILIGGYVGVGKSSLAYELYKPTLEKNGYFISGKFDQLKRNVLYAPLIQAIESMIDQILKQSKDEIEMWRQRIQKALGINARVIVDIIPSLTEIIGEQPPIATLDATEAKNRFKMVFQNFIQFLAQSDHPLVIFLDDCQWADISTLKLIESLLRHPESRYFLIIAAYRDNEVEDNSHPLMQSINNLQKENVIINTINLPSLTLGQVEDLLVDTLHQGPESIKSLANICFEKTKGNPFFLNQFLKTLYNEGLLEFDPINAEWLWDVNEINKKELAKDIIDLLIRKIKTLTPIVQNILKFAACLGNRFELEVLSRVSNQSNKQVKMALNEAEIKGLIVETSDYYPHKEDESTHYQFLHDRVQQAVYSLIDQNDIAYTHLTIGRRLLQHTTKKKIAESVFNIVDHINRGISLIDNVEERQHVAELNLMAGINSKKSIAYQTALHYLSVGINFLEKDCWETQYDLTLALYTEAIEAASLSSDIDKMESYSEIALQHTRNTLDKVRIYETQMIYLSGKRNYEKALDIGINVLNKLGIKMPRVPTLFNVAIAFLRLKILLITKSEDDLNYLPELKNPKYQAAMTILMRCGVSSFTDPKLFILTSLIANQISIKQGISQRSPLMFCGYAIAQCFVFNDIEEAYKFSRLSLRLLDRFPINKPITFLSAALVYYVHDNINESISLFKKGIQSGLEMGEAEGTLLSTYLYSTLILYSGKNLNLVYKEIEKYMNVAIGMTSIQKIFNFSIEYIAIHLQTAANLLDSTSNKPTILSGKFCNEKSIIENLFKKNDKMGMLLFCQCKLFLCYLFHDYKRAYKYAQRENMSELMIGFPGAQAYYHFYSLTCLACYPQAIKSQRKKLIKRVLKNQKKIKLFAKYAPMTFQHRYYLVEAELAHVFNQVDKAVDYYDRAINLAKQNHFIHEEALANELAGKFYLDIGRENIAKFYIYDAHSCYKRWGSIIKAKHLEKCYPNLFTTYQASSISDISAEQKPVTQMLDLTTVLKFSQAISKEVELESLLVTLMNIVIENAGAQKGFLLIENAGQLCIEAEASIDTKKVSVLQSLPINDDILPVSIVQYVYHNKRLVAFDDATQDAQFFTDAYILKNNPKSVLCMPLINQSTVRGILYMENNLITGAFTQDRLELLNSLSGQIITALDNARLFTNLKLLNQANQSFVPKEFLNILGKKSVMDLKLGDQIQEEMTVMFCDIRSFTSMCENMSPQDILTFLNRYISKMEPVITNYHGIIDKYIGDAIMALFPTTADDALRGAIAMLDALHEYNKQRMESTTKIDKVESDIRVGIGLNTGTLVLGTVGDTKRMDSTVISDTVNIAAEVEKLNKAYFSNILITQETYNKLTGSYAIRKVATVYIKKKFIPVSIYEVFDNEPSEIVHLKKQTRHEFEHGIKLFELGKYKKALAIFQRIQQINPEDLAAGFYSKRCKRKLR